MKILTYLLIIITITAQAQNSECNLRIENLFNSLNNSSFIFLDNNLDRKYSEELIECSKKDFVKYLSQQNVNTVALALYFLYLKNERVEILNFIKEFKYDNKKLYLKNINEKIYIGQYALWLLYEYDFNNDNEKLINIKKERKQIYIHLVSSKIKPIFYRYLLMNIDPYDEVFEVLEKYYYEDGINESLIAISKYDNSIAKSIIKDVLTNRGIIDKNMVLIGLQNSNYKSLEHLKLIELNGTLFAKTKKLFGGIELNIIKTLMSYQNNESYQSLNEILINCKNKFKYSVYREYIIESLIIYPIPNNIKLPKCVKKIFDYQVVGHVSK